MVSTVRRTVVGVDSDAGTAAAGRHSGDRTMGDALVELFGGQGTINVPSWSPDRRRIAYMSYPID